MGFHPSQMGGQMPQMGQQVPRGQPINNQQSQAVISRGPRPAHEGIGPVVTVFVGNITDRAPDNMVRQHLQHCGSVISWKRVQGASGVLQGNIQPSVINTRSLTVFFLYSIWIL